MSYSSHQVPASPPSGSSLACRAALRAATSLDHWASIAIAGRVVKVVCSSVWPSELVATMRSRYSVSGIRWSMAALTSLASKPEPGSGASAVLTVAGPSKLSPVLRRPARVRYSKRYSVGMALGVQGGGEGRGGGQDVFGAGFAWQRAGGGEVEALRRRFRFPSAAGGIEVPARLIQRQGVAAARPPPAGRSLPRRRRPPSACPCCRSAGSDRRDRFEPSASAQSPTYTLPAESTTSAEADPSPSSSPTLISVRLGGAPVTSYSLTPGSRPLFR